MRRPTLRIALPGLLAGGFAASCLSTDPVDFEARVRDASVSDTAPIPRDVDLDADVDDAIDGATPTCRECVEAPDTPTLGCGTEVAACKATPKCAEMYECLYAAGCWIYSDRKDFIVCGLPCAIEAGVISETDPEAVLAIAVVECAAPKCSAYCGAVGGDR